MPRGSGGGNKQLWVGLAIIGGIGLTLFVITTILILTVGQGPSGGGNSAVRIVTGTPFAEKGRILEDGLAVPLLVTNNHKSRRMNWHKDHDAATLRDEHGNTYKCIRLTPKRFIDPGQTAECVATFDVPVPQARHFLLRLGPDLVDGFNGMDYTFSRPPGGFRPLSNSDD